MVITEDKPFEELLKGLEGFKHIFLVGCGECATTCKTGGEAEVLKLKAMLEEQGKKVTGYVVPDAPCIASQVKSAFAKNISSLREAQAILILACGLGVQSVKDNNRIDHVVLPGCNTICIGQVDAQGNFFEKCSACGECVLELTGGICPVTLCPKGLLNGPCGGVDKGKCEVDKDKDCAWVLIYKELEKRNKLERMRQIQKPKDYKKTIKPHKIELTKNGR